MIFLMFVVTTSGKRASYMKMSVCKIVLSSKTFEYFYQSKRIYNTENNK